MVSTLSTWNAMSRLPGGRTDVEVPVRIIDREDEDVVRAVITVRASPKA